VEHASGSIRIFLLAASLILPVASAQNGSAGPAAGLITDHPDRRCLACHAQPHIAELSPAERISMVGTWLGTGERDPGEPAPVEDGALGSTRDEPETRPGLYVRADALVGSVHAGMTCVECHPDAAALPHQPKLELNTCAASCHTNEMERYLSGTHREAFEHNDPLAPTCVSCHGGHQIHGVGERQSPQHRLNSIFLCAECHERHMKDTPGGYKPRSHINAYLESAHGKAVASSGLVAAPTCADCHDAHAVHPVSDERSAVHHSEIHETCGACHVGILSTYQQSVHGRHIAEGDERAPVCTDCHTSHEIVQPDEVQFKLASGERCGHCHEERIEHYQETYHGKALALGLPKVAACYDCHGHHDIVPVDDPGSRLYGDKKLETCRQCHPGATQNFTGYIAHADHTNRELYPALYWTFIFMTMIVVGTFTFFGFHTILWFGRSVVLWIRHPHVMKDLKKKTITEEESFVRFRPFERFLHVLVMISFLLLVATGMPLKFYYTDWAKGLVGYMGGLEAAAQLHRFGAIITFVYFALHILSLVRAGVAARARYRDPESGRFSARRFFGVLTGPDLPFPHVRDLREWWAHQKWFFGLGEQPPFDKWTYWEKFDYLAVFWGVAVIGLSGLVMWFPEAFTRVLPGWTINIALIIHSDEALLAAGFIFTFHFFNVHFRPEKFPIDSVIFSGRITKTEMLHERRAWYDRLVAEGRLDSIRPHDDWGSWRKVIHPLGYTAFGTGLVLLALIIYAMGIRLLGGGH
jgi:thiosulfate reductase cytochrome b subunit